MGRVRNVKRLGAELDVDSFADLELAEDSHVHVDQTGAAQGIRTAGPKAILGTTGSIFGNRIFREGQNDWEEIQIGKNEIVTGIKGAVDAFVDSVALNAPVAVTGEDAFTTLAAAVAADTSAATGQVQIPEDL